MSGHCSNVGIIGKHVGDSLSPVMHNAAYDEAKVGRSPIVPSRMLAGLVTVILAAGQSADVITTTSAATKDQHPPGSVQLSTGKGSPESSANCLPNQHINLTLVKRKPSKAGQQALTFRAKSCIKTPARLLKNVSLSEMVKENGHKSHKQSWRIKEFPAHKTQKYNFSVALPKAASGPAKPENSTQTIVLKAESLQGKRRKRLGTRTYKLLKNGLVSVPQECHSYPGFEVGIFDDNAFVKQEAGSRERAFDAAESVLGAKALRLSIVYGAKDELPAYLDTIQAANDRGFDVQVSLMATPSYDPDMDQALSYKNLDPALMREFANDTVTAIKTRDLRVQLYYIHNEPNHISFNATQSKSLYNRMFFAGRAGVLDADPEAKIIAGGLAPDTPKDLDSWIENNKRLSSEGVAFHPYSYVLDRVPEIVKHLGGTPVYLAEYGNQADDPQQAAHNQQAIITAKCSGARLLTFMQLYRYPEITSWNTGIVSSPFLSPR